MDSTTERDFVEERAVRAQSDEATETEFYIDEAGTEYPYPASDVEPKPEIETEVEYEIHWTSGQIGREYATIADAVGEAFHWNDPEAKIVRVTTTTYTEPLGTADDAYSLEDEQTVAAAFDRSEERSAR